MILHRTVPEETTAEVEARWAHACALHPDWEHHTWRDPLDPNDFPTTSPYWGRCGTGAQLAGLVRLEALARHGGVYIDSDVDVLRPLDLLAALPGFAGWEDSGVVPDAVLGFEQGHPAVTDCIELALHRITSTSTDWRTGNGTWSTGPGVTTTVLPDRDDVLLLPPGSFYPYHYTEKAARDGEWPWAYAVHRWEASWL